MSLRLALLAAAACFAVATPVPEGATSMASAMELQMEADVESFDAGEFNITDMMLWGALFMEGTREEMMAGTTPYCRAAMERLNDSPDYVKAYKAIMKKAPELAATVAARCEKTNSVKCCLPECYEMNAATKAFFDDPMGIIEDEEAQETIIRGISADYDCKNPTDSCCGADALVDWITDAGEEVQALSKAGLAALPFPLGGLVWLGLGVEVETPENATDTSARADGFTPERRLQNWNNALPIYLPSACANMVDMGRISMALGKGCHGLDSTACMYSGLQPTPFPDPSMSAMLMPGKVMEAAVSLKGALDEFMAI